MFNIFKNTHTYASSPKCKNQCKFVSKRLTLFVRGKCFGCLFLNWLTIDFVYLVGPISHTNTIRKTNKHTHTVSSLYTLCFIFLGGGFGYAPFLISAKYWLPYISLCIYGLNWFISSASFIVELAFLEFHLVSWVWFAKELNLCIVCWVFAYFVNYSNLFVGRIEYVSN